MVRDLRSVKSQAEIDKSTLCLPSHGGGLYEYLRHHLAIGMTERQACKAMHLEMLRLGADACPYRFPASGQRWL
ncbi:hypothetical protein O9993_17585 [Vibrio lentus]|nr:hypothetical protein [Vibrio lentus]